MKKLILLILVLVAAPAFAGSYTLNTTAAQDTILERGRVQWNQFECSRLNLDAGCSLAEAQAADANTVYANNITQYIGRVLKAKADELKAKQKIEDALTFDQAWTNTNQATRDAICSSLSLPAGCKP